MPAISLLLPSALLAAAGLVSWTLQLLRAPASRVLAAIPACLAVAVAGGVWVQARAPLELTGPALGAGVRGDFRLDALALPSLVMILVPGAALLCIQRRSWGEVGAAQLAMSAACLAVEAGGVPLTALALGTAAVLVMLPVRTAAGALEPDAFSLWQIVGWVALLWAGAALQAVAGTAAYAAIPGTALGVPVFTLLAGGAVLVAGVTPWSSWLGDAARRAHEPSAAISLAVITPVGFYLLMRAYDAGGGHYPSGWLNVTVVILGLAVALAAGLRAFNASGRGDLQAELLVLNYGLALFALGLGSPLGLTAAVTLLLGSSLLLVLAPLLAEAGDGTWLLGLLVAAAVPPGLLFGGRVLAVQAGLEGGSAGAIAALAAVAAWVLSMAAIARGAGLPAAVGADAPRRVAVLVCAVVLAAGAALGLVEVAVAIPAAVLVGNSGPATPSGGLLGATTLAGSWPSAAFGIPLLALGGAVMVIGRRIPLTHRPLLRAHAPTVPPAGLSPARWAGVAMRGLAMPEEYRSLFDLSAIEATIAAGAPGLWLLVIAATAFAITR